MLFVFQKYLGQAINHGYNPLNALRVACPFKFASMAKLKLAGLRGGFFAHRFGVAGVSLGLQAANVKAEGPLDQRPICQFQHVPQSVDGLK